MGWGNGNLFGGGTSLNFKVVGGTTAPSNPKENTIWINTDVEITRKYFQAEQPEGMAEGEVWISTGTASQVAFNALKKDTIMVYPLKAKQMVSGTLVDVTAKSWQDGEWRPWSLYWFENGTLDSTIGYVRDTEDGADEWWTVDNSGFKVEVPADTYDSWIRSKNKVDVTNYITLYFVFASQTGGTATIGLTSKTNCSSFTAKKERTTTGAGTVSVDISNVTGSYYIGFRAEDTGIFAVKTVALIP